MELHFYSQAHKQDQIYVKNLKFQNNLTKLIAQRTLFSRLIMFTTLINYFN